MQFSGLREEATNLKNTRQLFRRRTDAVDPVVSGRKDRMFKHRNGKAGQKLEERVRTMRTNELMLYKNMEHGENI